MDSYEDKSTKKPPAYVDFLAGTVGGMAGHFVGQPLDVVKVLIQNNGAAGQGAIAVAKDLFKKEGVRGFFRGVLPPVTMEGAINAILFTAYGMTQKVIQKDTSVPLTIPQAAFCGAVASFPEVLVVCPMELVKIRIQLEESALVKVNEFKRTWIVSRDIARTEGMAGFTRGFGITIGRELPFMAIYFAAYEGLKQYYTVYGKISAFGQIMSGGLAGALAWSVVYPLDVLKTHMQASSKFSSAKHSFQTIMREQGVAGLYKGWTPCVIRAFPSNAVLFYFYELCILGYKNFT